MKRGLVDPEEPELSQKERACYRMHAIQVRSRRVGGKCPSSGATVTCISWVTSSHSSPGPRTCSVGH